MVKKIYLFLAAMIASMALNAQGLLPDFSTEQDPIWYQVQFREKGACLADQGAGQNLKTAAKAGDDAQKWQFIGNKDNFKMKSKKGNFVNFANGRFTTNKDGVELAIIVSPKDGNFFEIKRKGQGGTMNQWGGAGADKEIGEFNAGDTNNPLTFIAQSARLPEFSSADKEVWYFLQFRNQLKAFTDMGLGESVRMGNPEPVEEQMWKLVGTKEKFQIVNKLGHYVTVSEKAEDKTGEQTGANPSPLRTSDKEYAPGFSLAETTNATYAPAWEIQTNDKKHVDNDGKCRFNQFGGAGLGRTVGLWKANDPNNPVAFISPETMTYADYKVVGAETFTPESYLTLWYNQPATTTGVDNIWMEYALPIGNGQLGACIFGGLENDEIQFNEKTLWESGPQIGWHGGYKNFGSVFVKNLNKDIDHTSKRPAMGYVRYLDIEKGVAGVNFKNKAEQPTSYTRRYISSNPDNVIAAHYKAEGSEKLNLCFSVKPGSGINASKPVYKEGYATFGGKMTTLSYQATFKVVPVGEGAKVETTEDGVIVTGADEVLLLLTGATDFDASQKSFVSGTEGLGNLVKGRVDAAATKGWNTLYADHVADFTKWMGRVSFKIDGAASTVTTDQLVKNYNDKSKNADGLGAEALYLEQLYFAYGRYLMIGSSRGVDLPSNLQGIWNNKEQAPWNSDIHSNINVQMNYWPAEPTNLSELHLPFLNYIINCANGDIWKEAAKRSGAKKGSDGKPYVDGPVKGWTLYTENNIFGGMSTWGDNYCVANAWYCSHLWQHYRYTLDKEFLTRAFPVMWSAAEYWMQRMIKDRRVKDGTYVCPDEFSAEQHDNQTEDGTAHAQQLVYGLLTDVKQALDILGQKTVNLTDEQVARLNEYIANTDQGLHTEEFKAEGDWKAWGERFGVKKGDVLLKEWKYTPYSISKDKGHRHMSHLMALYPLGQVSKGNKYFEPAVNALKLRGDDATGWSMGWKVNLWARALDGNHAHKIVHNALKHSTAYGTDQGRGGIYYNLFDSHAPFQIDGNFGVCSGIAEMLMQSYTGVVQILPALPSVWKKGEANGFKAVGDFIVDMSWDNLKPTTVKILSKQGQPLSVGYQGIADRKVTVNGAEVKVTVVDDNTIKLNTKKDDVIVIDFSAEATGVEDVQTAEEVAVAVNGRQVTVNGAEAVVVNDLAGRAIQTSSKASFEVAQAAGHVVILQVTDKAGKVSAHKVVLK